MRSYACLIVVLLSACSPTYKPPEYHKQEAHLRRLGCRPTKTRKISVATADPKRFLEAWNAEDWECPKP